MMYNLKRIILFLIFTILLSCSDTIIKENAPDNSVDAPAIPSYFKQRVLIEDYTGTWCGWCARVAYGIDQVPTVTDKFVAVSIHGGGNDPWITPNTALLKNYFFTAAPNVYPEVRLNRTQLWTNPEAQNLADVKKLTSNNSGLGIAINATLSGRDLNVDTKIKLAQTYSNLRLVVYVVENGLIRNQANYTAYYNGENPIVGFVHNGVLKGTLTNVFGNAITESTILGQTITKTFTVALPTVYDPYKINITNTANIGIVAFVIDANNTVVNVRYANINDNQAFEENP